MKKTKKCPFNREENRILGLDKNELCSLERIYGIGYPCKPETIKACKAAEKALREG